jgi:hypothetical protein
MLPSRRINRSAVFGALVACGAILSWMQGGVADDPVEPAATAEETPAADAESAETEVDLPTQQQQLQRDYERFERSLYEVGEATRATDPVRAELLLRAQNESRTSDILSRLATVSQMLEERRFGESIRSQELLIAEMEALLKLLQSEDERQRLQAEIERIQDLLEDTNAIIGEQKDVRADTERGNDPEELEDAQQNVNEHAADLANKIDQQDRERGVGEPSESSPMEGSPMEGDPSEGSPMEGDPMGEGQPMEGESQEPGDMPPAEGEPMEGEPMEGEPMEGEPMEAEPMAGDPMEGEPMPGSPMPGSPMPGSPMPGSPMPGSPMPGSPMPGSPMPGSPMPGQPMDQPPGLQPLGPPPEGGGDQAGEQQDPLDQQTPGREELERAREEMEQAIKELEGRRLDQASDEQDEAVAELERMKAKLEEILRQLREKEKELFLQMLEARFQQMLQAQLLINSETLQLDQVPMEERQPRHVARATQLSRDELAVALEADKALNLLREEGSSVAFPEAVEQMRDNMLEVVQRLQDANTGATTQIIEQLIVETLEEMIFALQKEMEKLKQQEGEPPPPGEPQDPPLVDLLAELKMIRSLQNQINRLTQAYGLDINGEQATDAEQIRLLNDLSNRQERIQEATYDLSTGRAELGQ